jgi:cyclopropane fatty-acyl-phospholipid synthase-like methyltransferase
MKNCFICNSNAEHYSYWEKFEYVKCKGCGLVYVNEEFTEDDVYSAYTGGNLKNLRRKLVSPFRKFEHFKIYNEKMATTKKIMEIADKHVNASDASKMFDIGCNKGFLLAQGINIGFEPYGVELVPVLMDQFKRKFKAYKKNIYSENFSKVSSTFKDEQFDLITAIDVVEHFQEPRKDFENVFRVLKKGGAFLLQTPDVGSDLAKKEGDKWGALKAYEHLQLFDQKSLETLTNQIGFTKVDYYDSVEKEVGNMLAVLSK